MSSNRNNIYERDNNCNNFNSRVNTDGYNSTCNNNANQDYFGQGKSYDNSNFDVNNNNSSNLNGTSNGNNATNYNNGNVNASSYNNGSSARLFNGGNVNNNVNNNFCNSNNASSGNVGSATGGCNQSNWAQSQTTSHSPMGNNNRGNNFGQRNASNHYIDEHLRNKASAQPQQQQVQKEDNNRKTVKNASIIANDRRVSNNSAYNYDNTHGYKGGYNNASGNGYNNDINKPIQQAAKATKAKRPPMKSRTVAFIALWSLMVIVIVTLIVINCLPSATAQSDNGQNNVNQVYEQTALNKYIDSEGNVHELDQATGNPSYNYDTKTNWFDKLCDWMEKIGG